MKRLASVAALVLSLVACGSASTESIVLRPKNPLATGIYLKVTGSPEAARAIAGDLEHVGQSNGLGLVVASGAHGRQVCERTSKLVTYPVTVPGLRKLGGEKITFTVYGPGQSATVCQDLASELTDGLALVGGNRTIFRQPSSAMEPTLHCAKPTVGCLGKAQDRLVVKLTGAKDIQRQAIIVFATPKQAAIDCGEGGIFVKRVVGLPGETVREDGHGDIWIRAPGSAAWTKLTDTYVSAASRAGDTTHFHKVWRVPASEYFVLGDNRDASCDSRAWGSVAATNIRGPVVQIIRGGATLRPAGIPG